MKSLNNFYHNVFIFQATFYDPILKLQAHLETKN